MKDEKNIPPLYKRKFIINKNFQYRFIFRMMVSSTLTILLIFALNLYIFFNFNELGEALELSVRSTYYEFLNDQFKLLVSVYCGVVVTNLVFWYFYGIYYSHRIAGPIHNLKLKFEAEDELAKKRREKAIFRKNDFFHDIADTYNNTIAKDNEEGTHKKKKVG